MFLIKYVQFVVCRCPSIWYSIVDTYPLHIHIHIGYYRIVYVSFSNVLLTLEFCFFLLVDFGAVCARPAREIWPAVLPAECPRFPWAHRAAFRLGFAPPAQSSAFADFVAAIVQPLRAFPRKFDMPPCEVSCMSPRRFGIAFGISVAATAADL